MAFCTDIVFKQKPIMTKLMKNNLFFSSTYHHANCSFKSQTCKCVIYVCCGCQLHWDFKIDTTKVSCVNVYLFLRIFVPDGTFFMEYFFHNHYNYSTCKENLYVDEYNFHSWKSGDLLHFIDFCLHQTSVLPGDN